MTTKQNLSVLIESDPSKKRFRSENYSPDEKIRLISICTKYKHIIESKKTDAVSWKEKEDTWITIGNEFNASSDVYRDKDSLKKCYDNQKKTTRKVYAANRQETYKTGGGKNDACSISPIDKATILVMNNKTVKGLLNQYDDDSIKESCNDIDVELIEHFEFDDVISPEVINTNNPTNTEEAEKIETVEVDWGSKSMTASNLKSKKNLKLVDSSEKEKWSNRRRPSVTPTGNLAKKFEEVANIKKEVAEVFLENMRAKEEREKREHDIRLEILKLELEKKRKELFM